MFLRIQTCVNTDEWIKKMFLYTMEFYSAKKKIEILSSACIWRELKKINSRDVNQVQKAKSTYFLSDM
jgi:hypothetical protein